MPGIFASRAMVEVIPARMSVLPFSCSLVSSSKTVMSTKVPMSTSRWRMLERPTSHGSSRMKPTASRLLSGLNFLLSKL